jgi:hypothetical protein
MPLPLPRVENRLRPGLAVNEEQDGVALRRVEVGGPHQPPVELNPVADADAEEFDRPLPERGHPGAKLRVVSERPHRLVTRQADELRHGRYSE